MERDRENGVERSGTEFSLSGRHKTSPLPYLWRYACMARKPLCAECVIESLCLKVGVKR